MVVSVVISAYNRPEKLALTLQHLIANDPGELEHIEIVVVDNGSSAPLEPSVGQIYPPSPLSLKCIRLEPNAGPALARNAGFRATHGELVVFVDDDILAPQDLISKHVRAHTVMPKSVIFGRCALARPDPITPLFVYLESRGFDPHSESDAGYLPSEGIASGHVSFEREMFAPDAGIYSSILCTPGAEEIELAFRLSQANIPIFLDTTNTAVHNHTPTLRGMCNAAYRSGLGCAEVALKYPATRSLVQIGPAIRISGPVLPDDTVRAKFKKLAKQFLGQPFFFSTFLRLLTETESIAPAVHRPRMLYDGILGLYFSAGIRNGLSQSWETSY